MIWDLAIRRFSKNTCYYFFRLKMKIFVILFSFSFFFRCSCDTWEKNADNCENVASDDLLPLSDCSVSADKKHFLQVLCNVNCFAEYFHLGKVLYSILVTVGYSSDRPVTSANQSVCLRTTNMTAQKFLEPYRASQGTNFTVFQEIGKEISVILEGNVAIVFPKNFQKITGVAHIENFCNVSSLDFEVSAVDSERNASCKVKVFGIKSALFAIPTICIHSFQPTKVMHNANIFNLDEAIYPILRLRVKPNFTQKRFLSFLGNYKILHFEFLQTNFDTITNSDFRTFLSLEVLNLTRGIISTVESRAFTALTNLSLLDLSYNKLREIPDPSCLGPNTIYVSVEGNAPNIKTFVVSTEFKRTSQLSVLRLSRTLIYKLKDNQFVSFPNLNELYVDRCYIDSLSGSAFEKLISLSILDLSGNRIVSLPEEIFWPLVSLKYLNIGKNRIKSIAKNQVDKLNNLKFLNLENNLIAHLSFIIPPNLEQLNLRANRIKQWAESWNPSRLHLLDLSSNYITALTKEMEATLRDIRKVNLSGNPYDCSPCRLRRLQMWLQQPNVQNRQLYTCFYPSTASDKPVLGLSSSNLEDCLIKTANIAALASCLLFLAVTLGYAAYYRRWSIRYFGLKLTSIVENYKRNKNASVPKDYDAFVSYAPSERKWIAEELIPRLELGENPIRLCVHDRDEMAGNQIVQNIVEYIGRSRYVIFILSEGFIDEKWCILETHIAYQKLLEGMLNGLVLVKKGNISPRSLNKLLNYLIKTRTYLEWPSEEKAKLLFWERLKRFLSNGNEKEKMFSRLI